MKSYFHTKIKFIKHASSNAFSAEHVLVLVALVLYSFLIKLSTHRRKLKISVFPVTLYKSRVNLFEDMPGALISDLTAVIVFRKHKMKNKFFAQALVRHIGVQILTNFFLYSNLTYLCDLEKF